MENSLTIDQKFIEEFHHMETRLTELEEKIDVVDKKISQVVDAILGNPLTKSGGFVEELAVMKNRLNQIEQEQAENKAFKNRIIWTVGVIISIGVIIQYLINIYMAVKKP